MPSATLSCCVDAVVDGARETNPEINSGPFEFISFAMGDDQDGVDIMAVRELKGWMEITSLPHQPQYIWGALNLRGVIVTIIDLRCRFGQGLTGTTPLHIVIAVQIAGRLVGLIGDRVLDIVSVETNQTQPAPQVAQGRGWDCLSGIATVADGMIALIDPAHPLPTEFEGPSQQLNT